MDQSASIARYHATLCLAETDKRTPFRGPKVPILLRNSQDQSHYSKTTSGGGSFARSHEAISLQRFCLQNFPPAHRHIHIVRYQRPKTLRFCLDRFSCFIKSKSIDVAASCKPGPQTATKRTGRIRRVRIGIDRSLYLAGHSVTGETFKSQNVYD